LRTGAKDGAKTDANTTPSLDQAGSGAPERRQPPSGPHDAARTFRIRGKGQEIDIIKSGRIQYKHAEIFEASVRFIGATAIVLNRIRLDAVVGGNDVTNPFMVTEVYVQQNGKWKLGSLSFTRLLTP